MKIKTINAFETYAVRHPVLRPGRPLEDCKFEGDDLKTTFHLGLFLKNTIVGVVTFMNTNNPVFKNSNQFQLRGMAVLEAYQGLRLGQKLIANGETCVHKKEGTLIWLNARAIAVPFYKKNGFEVIGSPFNIPKIGMHYTMFKSL